MARKYNAPNVPFYNDKKSRKKRYDNNESKRSLKILVNYTLSDS